MQKFNNRFICNFLARLSKILFQTASNEFFLNYIHFKGFPEILYIPKILNPLKVVLSHSEADLERGARGGTPSLFYNRLFFAIILKNYKLC